MTRGQDSRPFAARDAVHAAVVAALALVLGRETMTSFRVRVIAALVGFTVASFIARITVSAD